MAADEKAGSGLAKKAERLKERKTLLVGVRTLLASRSFQAITFASALNDVGSWALVSWHATFYTKVFGIGPDNYAPMLAAIIPIGGIIGGVGSGLMGDWLSRTGNRHWLTSGLSFPPSFPSSFCTSIITLGMCMQRNLCIAQPVVLFTVVLMQQHMLVMLSSTYLLLLPFTICHSMFAVWN